MTIILSVALSIAVLFNIWLYNQREVQKRSGERYERLWKNLQDEYGRLERTCNVHSEIADNPILTAVQNRLTHQTIKGLHKYPNTVNPSDYEFEEWLTHIQEEAIDITVYEEVLRQKKREESK